MAKRRKKVLKIKHSDALPAKADINSAPIVPPKPNLSPNTFNIIAAAVIIILGIAVYISGIGNNFLGDDSRQIVNNPTIQSTDNIPHLFNGSTGYSGQIDGKLIGAYYRPLMMVFDTFLYSAFGPNPAPYHILQLAVHILGCIILFLFLRYSFKPLLALFLSLIFLAHPVNSQSVFYIASLQEPLYFLFGILGLWLLLRFSTVKSLILVALCLFLSLLAKETGALFAVMAATYLFIYDRKRFYPFLGMVALPITVYVILRSHALGMGINPHLGQIDDLNVWGRLATTPSVILFYLTSFIWPLHLAHAYYWVYPVPTFTHFVLPLLADLAYAGLVIYSAILIRRKLSHAYFLTFNFFAIWFLLGMALHAQIIPLDLTASTAWFYFSMAGLLGMLGVASLLIPVRTPRVLLVTAACVIIGLLGLRTTIRGFDWKDDITLAYHDVKISKEDYNSEFEIARDLAQKERFSEARTHAKRSVSLYSASANYEMLAYICLWSGTLQDNRKILTSALSRYPKDPSLWLDLAIIEYKNGNKPEAKAAISKAYAITHAPQVESFYTAIMRDEPLNLAPTH